MTGFRLSPWLLAAFLAGPIGAEQAPTVTVDSLVADHIAALGGAEAIAAVAAVEATGTMDINGVEQAFVIRFAGPKYRLDLIYPERPDTVEAFDGETAWVAGGRRDPAPRRLDGVAAQLVAEEAGAFGPLVDAKAAGHALELVGQAELDGETVWHLRLTRDSGRSEDWYLDPETHLPVRRVNTAVHRRSGDYERHLYLVEWQAVDGPEGPVQFPIYLEREDRQHVRAFSIDEVRINPDLDPKLFAAPPAEAGDGDGEG